MEQLFIRPKEAADAIGVGKTKIYELINDGTVPAVRIGRALRVPVEELRRWAQQQVEKKEKASAVTEA